MQKTSKKLPVTTDVFRTRGAPSPVSVDTPVPSKNMATIGQTASAEIEGKIYRLKVAKVYPQVRNGQFQIYLVFVGPAPASVQRGQTIQTKLTIGDSSKALLIPNGAFFNDTGGNWVFVVDKGGRSATKRQVQLGRKNSDFIEVLGGLQSGERVITSSYSGLVDKDHLTFGSGE